MARGIKFENLRDYQIEAIDASLVALNQTKRALVVCPTGLGKTALSFGLMLKYTEHNNKRVLFIADRIDLAKQNYDNALDVFDKKDVGLCCSSYGQIQIDRKYTFSTIQTVSKFIEHFKDIDLIVLDEVHVVSKQENSFYQRFIREILNADIFGMTATPFRDTGYIFGEGELFPSITYKKTLPWAIDNGFLVKPLLEGAPDDVEFDISKLKTVMGEFAADDVTKLVGNRDKVRAQVYDALNRVQYRNCIAWACANIDHAEYVKSLLPNSICYHSQTDNRQEEMNAILSGHYRHIVFVSVLSTGWDYPPCDTMVFMRPMRSAKLWIQTAGRILRLDPNNKTKTALILDYGRVIEACGPLDKPNVQQGKAKTVKKLLEECELKKCKNCLSFISRIERVCPACGYEFWTERTETLDMIARKNQGYGLFSSNVIPEGWTEHFVSQVNIKKTTSWTSGNSMVMIDYMNTKNISVKEYLVEQQWNKKKINERMAELQVKWNGMEGIAYKIPKRIWTAKNARNFNEVKRMEF